MSTVNQNQSSITQKQAEQTAQLINILFNNATFYGSAHPATNKSAQDLAAALEDIFTVVPFITLIRIGDSLYIEKWCVDNKMNAHRFIAIFQRAHIESISIARGTAKDDLKALIEILSDFHNLLTVDAMITTLQLKGISTIRMNYVVFEKITKDEAVISRTQVPHLPATPPPTPAAAREKQNKDTILGQISALFSLKELIEKPDHTFNRLINSAQSDRNAFVQQLKELNSQIDNRSDTGGDISSDDVMESVFKLTNEIKQWLTLQKELGKTLKNEQQVLDETENLTHQTVISLIKDEYNKGTISTRRLGVIIRRLVPDTKELKRILPKLKNALLDEGMPLRDFLQLVNELITESQNEGLLHSLSLGADELGLTADELVKTIRSDPQEVAKLIILASEIKHTTSKDNTQLSQILTDYIEMVSGDAALRSQDDPEEQESNALEHAVELIQNQLVEKIKSEKGTDQLVLDVQKQLAERFPKTLHKLKTDLITQGILDFADKKNLTADILVELLDKCITTRHDFEALRIPLETALKIKGLSAHEIQNLVTEITKTITAQKESPQLPKYLLSENNTKFFLQRQIKEYYRYKNPFTSVNISIAKVYISGSWKPPTKEIISIVLPDVCAILKSLLRDLDLVGTLGRIEESNNIFILLPMTDEKGAQVVKKRIQTKINNTFFTADTEPATVVLAISIVPFNKEKTPDLKSYRDHISAYHKAEEERTMNS